jgi:hypothetical protein
VDASTVEAARAAIDAVLNTDGYSGPRGDPEAVFLCAALAGRVKDDALALDLLEEVVRGGYNPLHLLETSFVFDSVRPTPRFAAMMETVRRRREVAVAIFERNGGGTLLGLAPGAA